jgi:methionyl-tRNA formyltransferase
MKSSPIVVILMTIENIHGREVLIKLLEYNVSISAIIIEHKSKLSENARSYLKNDFYNPKKVNDIIADLQIKTHFVENHNDEQTENLLQQYNPDYIVLGNARILKSNIIQIPKKGILNAHPAILPKYQGLDCVGWSILNGDSVGATAHFIDEGIDSGPIILQETVDYSNCRTLIEVRIMVMKICAKLLAKSILGLESGNLIPMKQNISSDHTYPVLSSEQIIQINNILSSN